jgi:hypothetical protein
LRKTVRVDSLSQAFIKLREKEGKRTEEKGNEEEVRKERI